MVNLLHLTQAEKLAHLVAKHGKRISALLRKAGDLVESSAPIAKRGAAIAEIADEVADVVAPLAICRRGCSHCCYQAVVISEWEAERIAKAIGVQVAPAPSIFKRDFGPTRDLYAGTPCVFLKDGACSVYDARPLACRLHFNMGDTADVCDTIKHPGARVPYYDSRPVVVTAAVIFFNAGQSFADIREFFPSPEAKR